MTRSLWLLLIVCITCFQMTEAATWHESGIVDNVSNVTLNFTVVDVSVDSLTHGSGINLTNISYNITGANISFHNINFTTQNSIVFCWQFPNVSSSSGNIVTILNGLSKNVSNVNFIIGRKPIRSPTAMGRLTIAPTARMAL